MSQTYDSLGRLWEVYLHMRAWGLPEYEQLGAEAREHFAELVKTGTLFDYVEDCKRDVVRAGINPPDAWLWPLCANRCAAGALPQEDRDQLGQILSQIYLRLVRLDPDAQAARQPPSHDIAELERTTPPLNTGDGQWVRNTTAAKLEGVETETLATYRKSGIATNDKGLGRDQDGRVWRREGTPQSHPWYLRSKLKSCSAASKKPG